MQPSGSAYALSSRIHLIPSESIDISSRESISSSRSDGLIENYEESADRIVRLEQELTAAKHSIAEKEAKCTRLSELQNHVDSEVQELTEKLFQEAYRMVNDAESRRAKAEKLLAESHLKVRQVDMLVAEVEALKIIVKSPMSSTPQVTHHLTSTIRQRAGLASRFLGNARRKERHSSANSRKSYTLPAAGRDSATLAQSKEREPVSEVLIICIIGRIDPIYHREFTQWRERGASMDHNSPFLSRIIAEDVCPCLNFSSTKLTEQVLDAIKANTLELEAVSEAKPTVRTCALSMVPRFCPYKMRVNGDTEWYYISLLARNRIAAVCDFFTYIRYVNQGIVKCGVHDSYWDIIALRKNMTLARLGLNFIPKIGGSQAGTL
uniref:Sec2p domain-containing protein n=1 Tax=Elaeophora elaphi TaxID=1147741 RepID=A0A0R3S3J0_9BILA